MRIRTPSWVQRNLTKELFTDELQQDRWEESAALLTRDGGARCLTWLSRTPETDFLIEDMQPSLLWSADPVRGGEWRRIYGRLSAAAMALFLALCVAIPCGTAAATTFAVSIAMPRYGGEGSSGPRRSISRHSSSRSSERPAQPGTCESLPSIAPRRCT